MDGTAIASDELDPPARLLDRLRQIAGYAWDDGGSIFHSSYDNWHLFGTRFVPAHQPTNSHASSPGHVPLHSPPSVTSPSHPLSASPSSLVKVGGGGGGGGGGSTRAGVGETHHSSNSLSVGESDGGNDVLAVSPPPLSHTNSSDAPIIEEPVVARVSYHVLREERAFFMAKSVISGSDPHGDFMAKPLDLIRLTPQPGDRASIIVAIYQHPGFNYLFKVLDHGPACFWAKRVGDSYEVQKRAEAPCSPPMPLPNFLDFAIGSVHCLEILHHKQGLVHGEIRGDAFHYNEETGKVKLMSLGSGLRSFEHGLTSTGWSALSKELGAKNKLLFISPEQTGRMPAEPDTRTDIYSLGVLFWSLLTQQPVFDGATPFDIVQAVLNRRIPSVSGVRLDVPDVIGQIIQKCTAKNISERYHSASGLRHDLTLVQKFLREGDGQALREWQIASKDVSSFFILPTTMIGRTKEKEQLAKVIERVAKSHAMSQRGNTNRYSDGSSLSNEVPDTADGSSEGGASSVDGTTRRSGSFTQAVSAVSASSETKFRNSFHPSVHSTHSAPGTATGPGLGPGPSASPGPSPASASGFGPGFGPVPGPISGQSIEVSTNSPDTAVSAQSTFSPLRSVPRPWERHQSLSSFETRSLADTILSGDKESLRHSAVLADSSSSLSRQLGSAKFRRRGHCEIVLIEGAGGLGKSCLLQSVLAENRRRGYSATAKFDTARRTAFGPLLRLLSSLFRQVWGERNTETPFHQALKQSVRPVWPMLHKVLGLPEFLLGPPEQQQQQQPGVGRSVSNATHGASQSHASHHGPSHTRSLRESARRRGSSPGSPKSLQRNSRVSMQSSQDFLRAGTSTKSIRLMNTILDVLRMFTQHKFICFCLEDLHFADDESIDLITQIIAARMKMVIIITYRPDELSPERVQTIIQPPESEEFPRCKGPTVTKIALAPLSEDEIVQYVSTTLCRPREEVVPLALVIQSKTAGNPFYMREMLNACNRKKCIWYDYRDCQWHYDLDRLFEQFKGEENYDVLDTDFITRRLDELPPASRAILSWAALLGNLFSFELVCHLLSGEFDCDCNNDSGAGAEARANGSEGPEGPEASAPCPEWRGSQKPTAYSQEEAVAGLQAAIQAYIVVPSDRDDRFRFAHDRYIQAAAKINQCDARKMHFIIAQTLMRHYAADGQARDNTAAHICESLGIIKGRVRRRKPYRELLFECAKSATVSGARPTAVKYFSSAVALLQPDPWDEASNDDVSYEETISLYLGAAECYLYMGQLSLASGVLDIIFASAKSPFDKAPASVLQSRVHAQSGDAVAALSCLRECLTAMGVPLGGTKTFEQCDAEFQRMSVQIRDKDRSELLAPVGAGDANMVSIGAVMAETISAAWWSDRLCFYQLSLLMMEMHLNSGVFPQSGMAFLHVAMIALSRFNMIDFAVELGALCLELLDTFRDPFSMARGYMIYANFVGHVQYPIGLTATQLEGSLDYAASAGDRISAILGFGLFAQLKFFASDNCAELEATCSYSCEEIPQWNLDTRGGVMLVAVRQVCRALQGKTRAATSAADVMTDDQHNSPVYKAWLDQHTNNGGRSKMFYQTLEMAPLFLYGHYEQAAAIGRDCVEGADSIWSARNTRFAMLFYGLALAGLVLRNQQDPRRSLDAVLHDNTQETVRQLHDLNRKITDWEVASDVNYLAWSKLLEAQMAELQGEHGLAIRRYEEALDHAAEHGFVFEEALGNYLMAGVFVRLAARRSAWSALRDAVALFRQMGAVGIAERIEEEHSLIMRGPTKNPRTAEVGVQTDFAGDALPPPEQFREQHHLQPHQRGAGTDDEEAGSGHPQQMAQFSQGTQGERVGAWRGSMTAADVEVGTGAGLPTLDMIDLHAILQSSQVISSVLNVDELLKTMCDVILQTCGGPATLAAIVVPDDTGKHWCVAASGNPDEGAQAHTPQLDLKSSELVAENVVLYSTRFREIVFVPDIISDERFGNVGSAWLERNPLGKAVIAMPICHGDKPLLGVLYLEGLPQSFTDRNVTVLQLLVNQIGISYSNALTMKAVEKVSAENVSMVSMQKRALEQARTAETKAKKAEADARRHVKIAEEAAKAKSIFLANVSHELRTPLNGVIGNSELLRDSNLNREQLEMADSIRVSADLLLTVINDILDFSKMEADKMKLFIIAFDPGEMVREVVRAASYSNLQKASKKNVVIVKEIDLPQMLIYGDPIRLHQVLGNLIGNSLKFTDSGTITIGARVESDTKDRASLMFWVRDTGIGIPPATLAKLFQPFSQADPSTARKYGGSGLGLSICKSLVESMMKGKIYLDSTEGMGTTAWFTVTFEKATAEVSAGDVQHNKQQQQQQLQQLLSPPSRSSSSGASGASERHTHQQHYHQPSPPSAAGGLLPFIDLKTIPQDHIRICIAEDNAINQKIAIQYTQRLGYGRVDAYDNGQKALDGLRLRAREGEPYHIILMDVQMPVLDGYETTKLIRKDPIEAVRKILVIAMTASAIQGDREKCLAAGMNDYLAKPVRSDTLKKKLEAYVGHSPSPNQAAHPGPSNAAISPLPLSSPLIQQPTMAPSPVVVTSTQQRPGINGLSVAQLPLRESPAAAVAAAQLGFSSISTQNSPAPLPLSSPHQPHPHPPQLPTYQLYHSQQQQQQQQPQQYPQQLSPPPLSPPSSTSPQQQPQQQQGGGGPRRSSEKRLSDSGGSFTTTNSTTTNTNTNTNTNATNTATATAAAEPPGSAGKRMPRKLIKARGGSSSGDATMTMTEKPAKAASVLQKKNPLQRASTTSVTSLDGAALLLADYQGQGLGQGGGGSGSGNASIASGNEGSRERLPLPASSSSGGGGGSGGEF